MAPNSGGFLGPIALAFDHLRSILSPSDFTILWRPGRPVVVRGRVARAKTAGIARFFSHDLNLPGTLTVWGNWASPVGSLRLRFSGKIGAGDRQRVRNFLMEHLK